jgi:hypothetical protein
MLCVRAPRLSAVLIEGKNRGPTGGAANAKFYDAQCTCFIFIEHGDAIGIRRIQSGQ